MLEAVCKKASKCIIFNDEGNNNKNPTEELKPDSVRPTRKVPVNYY
jgi:hypothetical protein